MKSAKFGEWTRVEDALPEKAGEYICFGKSGYFHYRVGWFSENRPDGRKGFAKYVTHWMPLPDPSEGRMKPATQLPAPLCDCGHNPMIPSGAHLETCPAPPPAQQQEAPVPEKVFAFRVTRPETHGNSWCVYGDWDSVHDAELDDATPGDKITVELIEMTKEELDELEPFEGW